MFPVPSLNIIVLYEIVYLVWLHISKATENICLFKTFRK